MSLRSQAFFNPSDFFFAWFALLRCFFSPVPFPFFSYVDFILVLYYFPIEGGRTTKPNAGRGCGAGEPFVFPFW